ncbi:MAG TPA: SUMF1/EgtB/PvdO family nonheme iron enzyme [Blastocatellia bacterium]
MPVPSLPTQQKSETLRDLDQRASALEAETRLHQVPDLDSQTKSAETSFLPGTAGSRSEQQIPTGEVQMGRTTGPVEEADQSRTSSGELAQEAASVIETTAVPADLKEPPLPVRETTSSLGSESTAQTQASESKTEVFVSPQAPHARVEVSQDDVGTQQFAPERWQDVHATKEFQSPASTVSEVAATTSPTQPVGAELVRPRATAKSTLVETASVPIAQTPSAVPPIKRGGAFVASVSVALVVIGGAIFVAWWLLFSHRRPVQPTTQVKVEQPPVTSEPRVIPPTPVVPEGMIAVAAGSYTIGKDSADPAALERPQHKVDLTAFFIDRTEVTNAAYKRFVDAAGHKAPTNWTDGKVPEGRENYPVTGVTWQDTADYAAWAGKRLPTEAEWEAAARGADGRVYPWGNGFRADVANIGVAPDKPGPEQYPKSIKEVGRYPDGASPVGAVDMIGNVWEWVADEIKPYPGNTDSKLDLEYSVTYRVIRGGAYDGNKSHDATYRGYLDASQAYPKVGFRCAKDAK